MKFNKTIAMTNSNIDSRQVKILDDLLYDEDQFGREKVEKAFRKFDNPRPYVAVIGFAYDGFGRFPVFKRSDKVRSARNSWSVPSGLHEVGKTLEVQFAAELEEELNLTTVAGSCQKIGFYEPIIYKFREEPNWHWVMVLMATKVESLDTLTNKEPEKHSDIRLITTEELYSEFMAYDWTIGLKEALIEYRSVIEDVVNQGLVR